MASFSKPILHEHLRPEFSQGHWVFIILALVRLLSCSKPRTRFPPFAKRVLFWRLVSARMVVTDMIGSFADVFPPIQQVEATQRDAGCNSPRTRRRSLRNTCRDFSPRVRQTSIGKNSLAHLRKKKGIVCSQFYSNNNNNNNTLLTSFYRGADADDRSVSSSCISPTLVTVSFGLSIWNTFSTPIVFLWVFLLSHPEFSSSFPTYPYKSPALIQQSPSPFSSIAPIFH